ncbi:MAG: LLM class F420-dependent oxidoreductase [Actinomycetota bacterium]
MKFAVHLANLSWDIEPEAMAPALAEVARIADEGGVATLTMMDHWFQMEQLGGPLRPMLEGYTSLGFLAGQTRNLELGLLVTGVTYRHPGLLAKIVSTLDVLSRGRAMLGLGAAWYEREHRGLGVPFPPLKERFERLEETIQICRQMWSGNDGPYEGHHYQLSETICLPRPVSAPGPRLLIGGSGERKTLRLVARYASACNLFATSPDEVAHKVDVLNRHCENEGRDPAGIQKTIIGGPDPLADVDGFLQLMSEYAQVGISQVWSGPPGPRPAGWVSQVCTEVVPRLADI